MSRVEYQTEAVYGVVRGIPPGRVCNYGLVGLLAWGLPGRARMVGRAMSRCSDPTVPCHRVVFADGSLNDSFGALGRLEWSFLLESEGVPFAAPFRVDMKKALWTGETL